MVQITNFAILLLIIVIIEMSQQNTIIKELQCKVHELEVDLAGLRYHFDEERTENNNLRNRIDRIRRDKAELIAQKNVFELKNEMLQEEIGELKERQAKLKPIRVNKIWNDLNCNRTKFKRKAKYKDVLDLSLSCITECKRAKVSLTLGEEEVDIKLTEKEMNTHRANLGITLPERTNILPDPDPDSEVNVSSPVSSPRNDQNNYDIFDDKYKITQKHKRTIITAMDKHRISHKAYHAIRKAGKQNWPSLNMIKKEKKEMSNEIPFTTDNEVFHLDL